MNARRPFGLQLLPADVDLSGIAARGTRRWLILATAAFTTVVEAAALAGLLPDIPVGDLELSISLLPALALAIACGSRLLGRSSFRRMAITYWVAAGVALFVLAVICVQTGQDLLWVGLVLAALSEELVYRLAVPATLAALLQIGGVGHRRARIAGLTLAGMWFVLLPGHQHQYANPAEAVPFAAFAALSAVLVYRSGSVLPMAASHAIVNLTTVLMWKDAVAGTERGFTILVVLLLLVSAYGRPRRFTLDRERGMVDTFTGLRVNRIHSAGNERRLAEPTDHGRMPFRPTA